MAVDRTTQALSTAVQLHRAGKLDQAAKLYSELRLQAPRNFDVWHLSGTLSLQMGKAIDAVTALGQAHQLSPRDMVCLMRLALAEMQMGQLRVAVTRLEKVVATKYDFYEAWDNLGMARKMAGDLPGGLAAHRRAVQIRPQYAHGWYNLGHALIMNGQPGEALAAFDRVLKTDPNFHKAHFGRGIALQALHRIPEAVRAYEDQLLKDPKHLEARSCRLMALHYLDGISPAALADQHRRYGAQFSAAPAATPRQRAGAGKMRIGFISPDLRRHAVASFFEPLLRHLDRTRCEIFLYHDHFVVDAVSERLRSHADTWRHIVGQSHDAVEKQLRQDELDVLVDLAGHTGLNRLPVFARRVAPLQATYLGYPNTTGLAAMDLRFTDAWADPEGEADALHTEKLIRLSPCAWTWQPPADAPEVPPLPFLTNGYVTFGSFNNASKLSNATLKLWAQVLGTVPESRLVLKSSGLEQAEVAAPLRARAQAAGLPMDRVTLLGYLPDEASHLAAYGEIDIALDPFPYNGTTTTCEALWMGRPVITLAGDRHSARVGGSLLTAIGHPEWVAKSEESYVEVASTLAGSASELAQLSETLRRDTEATIAVCGTAISEAFVQSIESATRAMAASA